MCSLEMRSVGAASALVGRARCTLDKSARAAEALVSERCDRRRPRTGSVNEFSSEVHAALTLRQMVGNALVGRVASIRFERPAGHTGTASSKRMRWALNNSGCNDRRDTRSTSSVRCCANKVDGRTPVAVRMRRRSSRRRGPQPTTRNPPDLRPLGPGKRDDSRTDPTAASDARSISLARVPRRR